MRKLLKTYRYWFGAVNNTEQGSHYEMDLETIGQWAHENPPTYGSVCPSGFSGPIDQTRPAPIYLLDPSLPESQARV